MYVLDDMRGIDMLGFLILYYECGILSEMTGQLLKRYYSMSKKRRMSRYVLHPLWKQITENNFMEQACD